MTNMILLIEGLFLDLVTKVHLSWDLRGVQVKSTCSAQPFASDILEDVTYTSPVQHGNVVFDITICDGKSLLAKVQRSPQSPCAVLYTLIH